VRAASSEEHRDPDQPLDDEQGLSQHQGRTESATRRRFAEIEEQPPDADDHGDEKPGSEQAAVQEQKSAQEASCSSSTREIAVSSVSLEFLKLIARRASAGENHCASSISESCGLNGLSPAYSTK